jgi:hypothetical protein
MTCWYVRGGLGANPHGPAGSDIVAREAAEVAPEWCEPPEGTDVQATSTAAATTAANELKGRVGVMASWGSIVAAPVIPTVGTGRHHYTGPDAPRAAHGYRWANDPSSFQASFRDAIDRGPDAPGGRRAAAVDHSADAVGRMALTRGHDLVLTVAADRPDHLTPPRRATRRNRM